MEPRKAASRLRLAAAGLAAAAMMLAAAGCGSSAESEHVAAAAKAMPAPPAPAPAKISPPAASTSSEILSVLSVEHEVDVMAQRDGMVTGIDAEEGAVVDKDAGLARLDDRTVAAQLEKARADLRVSESNVKYNEAELKASEARLKRAQEMFKLGLNSQADLEEAEFRAKGSAFDLESWHAAVDRSKADIRLLEVELEKTRVRAPFRGAVTRRYIREGQTVQKDEKCFRLSQLEPLLVHFQVPETSPRRPLVGDSVRGETSSDSKLRFDARIQRVSPTVDAASGTYDVIAALEPGSNKDLRPGMAVKLLWGESQPAKP